MNRITKTKFYSIASLAIVSAAAAIAFPSNQASALTVSPPKIEIDGGPESAISQIIKLYNETDKDAAFFAEVQDFKARGELGEPEFVEADEEASGSFSLASWIEIAKEPILLAPGERKEIPIKVIVPKDAEPGGHYAGVLFSTQSSDQKSRTSSIGISGKLGCLILLRAGGEIKEEGKLLEFGTKEGKKFFSSLPVEFYLRFENQGNVHLKPRGDIEIKGIFDITSTPAKLEVNRTEGNVLPGSVRRFESVWNKNVGEEICASGAPCAGVEESGGKNFFEKAKNEWENFALGKYQAKLALYYGVDREQVSRSVEFWVIPWRLTLCLIIGLVLLIIGLKFGIKKYNKWVIEKAGTRGMKA